VYAAVLKALQKLSGKKIQIFEITKNIAIFYTSVLNVEEQRPSI
jgi:hypothetical protein